MTEPFKILEDASKTVDPGYKNSRQMLEDFRNVFQSTPAGQRVFHQIMDWAGFFRPSYVKNDPYATHMREGEKNLAIRIWAACVQEPKELPTETTHRGKHG